MDDSFFFTGLKDRTTYYWTVVPVHSNIPGRCLNGVFSFTVDTSFVPTYILDAHLDTEELEMRPGEDSSFMITLVNKGNMKLDINLFLEGKISQFVNATDRMILNLVTTRTINGSICLPPDTSPGKYWLNIKLKYHGECEELALSVNVIEEPEDGEEKQTIPQSRRSGIEWWWAAASALGLIIVVTVSIIIINRRKKEKDIRQVSPILMGPMPYFTPQTSSAPTQAQRYVSPSNVQYLSPSSQPVQSFPISRITRYPQLPPYQTGSTEITPPLFHRPPIPARILDVQDLQYPDRPYHFFEPSVQPTAGERITPDTGDLPKYTLPSFSVQQMVQNLNTMALPPAPETLEREAIVETNVTEGKPTTTSHTPQSFTSKTVEDKISTYEDSQISISQYITGTENPASSFPPENTPDESSEDIVEEIPPPPPTEASGDELLDAIFGRRGK